jgi:predicted nuclease with TOPRIM domain
MESEKVKEIKDSIQRKINRAEKVGDDLVNCVSVDILKAYLTLINELESENEMLKQHKRELQGGQQDLIKRIAELEKHIERVESERIRIKQDRDKKEELASKFIDSYNDSLKQFAERLIEKAKKGSYIDKRSHANLTDFIIDIDETLKEFIDD